MRHLNYNHLYYFWIVANEGSVARAAEVLHLTPQTISAQLKSLDRSAGSPLFRRAGRGLELTETGRVVRDYAADIFALGTELVHRLSGAPSDRPDTLNIGVVDSIPKLIACRILAPALEAEAPTRLSCIEGDLPRLLGELAVHRLDLIVSDRPLPPGLNVRAYNHALGESSVSFFASPQLPRRYRQRFPEGLQDAPMLLPSRSMALRRGLDEWFDRHGLVPRIAAEFDDSALMKAFGEAGLGVFPGPTAIAKEIESTYGCRELGTADELTETFYAISHERRLNRDAIVNLIRTARLRLRGG